MQVAGTLATYVDELRPVAGTCVTMVAAFLGLSPLNSRSCPSTTLQLAAPFLGIFIIVPLLSLLEHNHWEEGESAGNISGL